MKKVIIAVIILSVAALSFVAGGWYGRKGSNGAGTTAERKVLYYVDPMNPGFRSDKPGIAPCGMPLEPVYAGEDPSGKGAAIPGMVNISPARQQLIGVRTATVEKKPSSHALRLYGKVAADETKVYRLNASTDSWVREISGATTGSLVDKDVILAEMLAPAFFNAQQNYLIQLGQMDRIRQQLGGELRPQQTEIADSQIRMAVQSLQTLGITDAQIAELAKTRKARPYLQIRSPVKGLVLSRGITLYQWFKAGEEFYRIADIGKVWVVADVYENEARHLKPGMTVKVTQAQMGKTFNARVSNALPLFDQTTKTLKVRFDVDNPRYDLRPDMFVDVEIPVSLPAAITVPVDAVVDSGLKKVVYVDKGNGYFEPRRVETGWRYGNNVEITGGLMPGEKVVVSGVFLIDSESRMRLAASGVRPDSAQDPVCRMYVDEEKAKSAGLTSEKGGKTYFFCSEECKRDFGKDPKKYTGTDTGQQAGSGPAEMHKPHGAVTMKEKRKESPKGDTDNGTGKVAEPKEEKKPAPIPDFPGARYLGTDVIKKDPADRDDDGDDEDNESDKRTPGHYEVPMAPPGGTRLGK